MQFIDVFRELVAKHSLDLEFDNDEKSFIIEYEENSIVISLNEERHSVLCFCKICNADVVNEPLLKNILDYCCYGIQSDGVRASLYEADDSLVLWKIFKDEFTDAYALEEQLSSFISQVLYVKSMLDNKPVKDNMDKKFTGNTNVFMG